MKYAIIRDIDIVNGDGVGVSIFFQGCSHHCKGCFNQETWNFNDGKDFTEKVKNEFIKLCKRDNIDFISLLGGEPFDQPLGELLSLLKELKELNKPIYVWTGYLFEDLWENENPIYRSIFQYITYLIDGEFQENKKDLTLHLRGSSNQRIIDVQKTLLNDKIFEI
jgi:anaerobic ribonucleoside-triphosphate reductase activating protein